ncbi:hypothetical protein RPYSC3_47820 [Rhodopseudomonas palustris]|nr:hypothetical protein RPYSC3_47820 [Rhodopseudomonas palustris]
MEQIKTLEEAEKVREQYPYMYLVAFVSKSDSKSGSMVVSSKDAMPLWRVYFMVEEAGRNRDLIIITNIIDLTK